MLNVCAEMEVVDILKLSGNPNWVHPHSLYVKGLHDTMQKVMVLNLALYPLDGSTVPREKKHIPLEVKDKSQDSILYWSHFHSKCISTQTIKQKTHLF